MCSNFENLQLQQVLFRFEIQAHRVDAISFPAWLRAIFKNMAQVGIALRAAHFHAHHAVAGVGDALDVGSGGLCPEAGPAAAGVEFGVAVEQQRAAADAEVVALLVVKVVFAAERTLGAGLSGHAVLLRRQLGAPFGVGFLYGHGGCPCVVPPGGPGA